jgi:flagellar biosynthesis protein FlhB
MSLGIPIIRQPTLARSLFKNARTGKPIPTSHYRAVAELYFELYARQRSEDRPG